MTCVVTIPIQSLSSAITKRGACLARFTLRDETCSVTCDYSTGKCEEKVSATECDCEGNKKETKSSASFEVYFFYFILIFLTVQLYNKLWSHDFDLNQSNANLPILL